jgi:hypothetical protein
LGCSGGAGKDCAAAATVPTLPVQVSKSPRVYVKDDLFSPEECLELIESGSHLLEPATIMGGDGKLKPAGKYRSADTTSLLKGFRPIVDVFRKRMANLALMPEEHGEPLQLTRYRRGQKYEAHFDSSLLAGRLATVIVFLGAPESGGELAFPWARREEFARAAMAGVAGPGRDVRELRGLKEAPDSGVLCFPENQSLLIAPKSGRAVVWFNHTPDLKRVGFEGMHLGCPVTAGTKFITQVFFDWFEPGKQNSMHEIIKSVGLAESWMNA